MVNFYVGETSLTCPLIILEWGQILSGGPIFNPLVIPTFLRVSNIYLPLLSPTQYIITNSQ